MKKALSTILSAALLLTLSAGCNAPAARDDGKISVVTTIFPEYDWVRRIAGSDNEDLDITLLTDNGVDLHNFQPSTEDILMISECDIFIYVGGESDQWVNDALDNATNDDMIVINLLDILGERARIEETVEGMQAEDEDAGVGDDEEEYDEHVWLSLNNAVLFVEAIKDALIRADSEDKDLYENNAEAYINEIKALNDRYLETVARADHNTLIFGDRFPFVYLVKDYGLDYYAAFSGCSAETEASFETIVFLSRKMDELKLDHILIIDGSDDGIARTIVENTSSGKANIIRLDSMQSVDKDDIESGISYLSIMEANLAVIEEALS